MQGERKKQACAVEGLGVVVAQNGRNGENRFLLFGFSGRSAVVGLGFFGVFRVSRLMFLFVFGNHVEKVVVQTEVRLPGFSGVEEPLAYDGSEQVEFVELEALLELFLAGEGRGGLFVFELRDELDDWTGLDSPHGGVEVVFYRVLRPARQLSTDGAPRCEVVLHFLEYLDLLFLAPAADLHARVQDVDPPLAALLAVAAENQLGAARPLCRPVVANLN